MGFDKRRGGGGFGGGKSFGGSRGGSRFGGRDSAPQQMHQAVCADCGNKCEVPFRPTGDKPVYCRDCFSKKGGGRSDSAPRRDFGDSAPRRDFNNRPSAQPSFGGGEGMGEVKRQLEALNSKLDKLVQSLAAQPQIKKVEAKAVVKAAPKKAEKKAAPKKKTKK